MATPFDGKLKLNEVSLAGARKFLNNAALEGSDAMISGSTDLVNAGGKMSANGSLKITDAVVHNVQGGLSDHSRLRRSRRPEQRCPPHQARAT